MSRSPPGGSVVGSEDLRHCCEIEGAAFRPAAGDDRESARLPDCPRTTCRSALCSRRSGRRVPEYAVALSERAERESEGG